ncbi:MAG: hypothetical protein WCE30_23875 [Mycobacterium sp.]
MAINDRQTADGEAIETPTGVDTGKIVKVTLEIIAYLLIGSFFFAMQGLPVWVFIAGSAGAGIIVAAARYYRRT